MPYICVCRDLLLCFAVVSLLHLAVVYFCVCRDSTSAFCCGFTSVSLPTQSSPVVLLLLSPLALVFVVVGNISPCGSRSRTLTAVQSVFESGGALTMYHI